jgi:glycerol-3-phosphate acyltransferase PlsY
MLNIYIILGVLTAYLLGSIPSAVWIGRIFYNTDVREKGSHNAGATNVIRVLGLKAGIPVLVLDCFKGWLAVKAATFFGQDLSSEFLLLMQIVMGAAAVIGHLFPVLAGFRGGKGIATLLGIGIALYPLSVLFVLAIFIIIFLVSGYVSLASIIAAVSFPLLVIFVDIVAYELPLQILSVAVGIFVPVTHHKNIVRLVKGKESRFHLRKKPQGEH